MDSSYIISSFKSNLFKIRKRKGFSQRSLAKKLGVSQRVVSYYERDATNVPLSRIVDLANALDVSVIELLDPKIERKNNVEELDIRIIRKIRQIEKLPRRKKESLWQTINNAIEINAIKTKRNLNTNKP